MTVAGDGRGEQKHKIYEGGYEFTGLRAINVCVWRGGVESEK